MKKLTTKLAVLLIVAAFIAAGMCAVPIVNVDCGGPEPATMTVYGFNLMGFSAWGIIPILAVLIAPLIITGSQSRGTKETELIFLFMANAVSYLHSFNTAKMWFMDGGHTLVKLGFGAVLFPLGFLAVLLAVKFLNFAFEVIESTFVKESPQEEI